MRKHYLQRIEQKVNINKQIDGEAHHLDRM